MCCCCGGETDSKKCNNWSGATIRAGTPSLQDLAAPRGLVSTSWALGGCVRAGQKPLWGSPVSPAGNDAPSALEPAAPTLPSPGTRGRDEGPSQPHSEHFRNSGSFPSPFGEDVTEPAQKESSGIWGRWRTACRAGLHAGLTPRWSQPPPSVPKEGSTCGCTRRLDSSRPAWGPQTQPGCRRTRRSLTRQEELAWEPHQAQAQMGISFLSPKPQNATLFASYLVIP